MKRGFVIVVLAYAAVLLDGGLTAFMTAPPEANAATALIVPGACAVVMLLCAVGASLIDRNRAVGMIGIHAGLVLPLVFAAAFAFRAMAAAEASAAYNDPAAVVAEGGEAPDHDKGYLAWTLWRLTGLSGVAFVGLLLQRPKPAARGAGPTDS